MIGPQFPAVEWVCWELHLPGRTKEETFSVHKQILICSGVLALPRVQNYLSPPGPSLMLPHVLRPPPGLCLFHSPKAQLGKLHQPKTGSLLY